jgi:hypothetical protein
MFYILSEEIVQCQYLVFSQINTRTRPHNFSLLLLLHFSSSTPPTPLLLLLLQLAELKSVFDRFAVDSCITAPETVQALTEAGIVAPRRWVWVFWEGCTCELVQACKWGGWEWVNIVCACACRRFSVQLVCYSKCVTSCERRVAPPMTGCARTQFDLYLRSSEYDFTAFSVFFTGKYLNICGVGST